MTKEYFAYGYKHKGREKYIIWGVGETPAIARGDGTRWVEECSEPNDIDKELKKCKIFRSIPSVKEYVESKSGCWVPKRYIKG